MTVAEARTLFGASFGGVPQAVFSAPGRVNLIGEHTDYNDGFVLPFAIQLRTQVAASVRSDDVLRLTSTFSPTPVEVRLRDLDTLFPTAAGAAPAVAEWAAYPLGVAWAMLARFPDAQATGLDLAFASDVPIGAGLSSSAAIEAATSAALAELWHINGTPTDFALAGRRAENEAVGAPTGIMDQMAVNLSTADSALFLDCRTLEANVTPLGFATAGLQVVVMDTGIEHAHATGGYRDRRESCERGARILGVPTLRDITVKDLERAEAVLDPETFRRVRHVVAENQRVLDTVRTLREHGPDAIGSLLDASHASMRDDFEISVPEIDLLVETARAHGALGARLTGGGFGGAAIALVPDADVEAVMAAATATGVATSVSTVTPSSGPRRDT